VCCVTDRGGSGEALIAAALHCSNTATVQRRHPLLVTGLGALTKRALAERDRLPTSGSAGSGFEMGDPWGLDAAGVVVTLDKPRRRRASTSSAWIVKSGQQRGERTSACCVVLVAGCQRDCMQNG
jgi:hypothetical protein